MKVKDLWEAYHQGQKASHSGTVCTNPYPEGSHEYYYWRDGYVDDQKGKTKLLTEDNKGET